MRSAPVAAAPASQLDYFSVFGLKRRFGVDRTGLERRFYELSRATHPDRFTTAGPEAQRESLVRMSELNDAYRILKDPGLLREHYLELEGLVAKTEKAQIPVELAESWFELQDGLMEDPAGAAAKVAQFENELSDLRMQGNAQLTALERQIDDAADAQGSAPRELLEKLSSQILAQSYLKSMERDVERIKRSAQPAQRV